MDLATNTTARLMTVATDTRRPDVHVQQHGSGTLTLTGADGSHQTINVTDMTAGTNSVLNFDQLGIS